MARAAQTEEPAKRARGRPRLQPWSVAEVAEWLGMPEERVLRSLTSEKARACFFPHAKECEGVWAIPDADMRALCGDTIPRLMPVKEFAHLVGFSVPWVSEMARKGKLVCRRVWGKLRIPASAYFELPEERPAGTRKLPVEKLERSKGDLAA